MNDQISIKVTLEYFPRHVQQQHLKVETVDQLKMERLNTEQQGSEQTKIREYQSARLQLPT